MLTIATMRFHYFFNENSFKWYNTAAVADVVGSMFALNFNFQLNFWCLSVTWWRWHGTYIDEGSRFFNTQKKTFTVCNKYGRWFVMLHIEIERERKFNICIEIQSHAQHVVPLLSEHICLPIVCAYTSAIVMEFYLFCRIAVSAHIDTNWLISLFTFYISLQK